MWRNLSQQMPRIEPRHLKAELTWGTKMSKQSIEYMAQAKAAERFTHKVREILRSKT